MKFAYSILILPLFWHNSAAKSDENACMNREYKKYDEYTIMQKFDSEYSVISGGIQKLFGKPKVPSQKEKDNVIQLCGCMLLKLLQEEAPSVEIDINSLNKILPFVQVEAYPINFRISYYFFGLKHSFPAHICTFEDEKCIIAKGSAKKSKQKEIYNIYVGIVTTGEDGKPKYDLEGIIDKVDVEMPAFGNPAPKQISTSESTKN